MRFSINTLGCKVNLCESDGISRILTDNGFRRVDYRSGSPHVCIINTCTVTGESDRKVRQIIRKIKKANTQARLVITGCYVEDHEDLLKKSGVDLMIGNDKKRDIQRMASDIMEFLNAGSGQAGKERTLETKRVLRSRPIVKIQDGCEQDCAYCIIPRVRGDYYSTPESMILESIGRLAGDGYEEVVLTGIHIGKYGVDMPGNGGMPGLLDNIFTHTDIKRIRISSIEVNEITSPVIDVMKKYRERISPHLHIPLQSGSSNILARMGRPYDSLSFRETIKNIRESLPGVTLTTDVMVGFPGESEEDFEKTLELVREIGFSKLHVFRYSPRPETRAYYFGDDVPSSEKNRRSRILRECGDSIRQDFLHKNMGRALDVVVERQDDKSGMAAGTSGNYIKVYFKKMSGTKDMRGRIIKIKTEKRYRQGLLGKQVL